MRGKISLDSGLLKYTEDGKKVRGIEKFSVLIELLPKYIEDESEAVEKQRHKMRTVRRAILRKQTRGGARSKTGIVDTGHDLLDTTRRWRARVDEALCGAHRRRRRAQNRKDYARFTVSARNYLNTHRARRYAHIVRHMQEQDAAEAARKRALAEAAMLREGKHADEARAAQGGESGLRVNHLHYEALLFEQVTAVTRQLLLDSPYFDDYYQAQKVCEERDTSVRRAAFGVHQEVKNRPNIDRQDEIHRPQKYF